MREDFCSGEQIYASVTLSCRDSAVHSNPLCARPCRVAVLQQLLGKGYNVLAVDADLVWLREPFAVLEAASGNFLVSADSSDAPEQAAERPCAGVIFARAAESTRCAPAPAPDQATACRLLPLGPHLR